MQSRNYLTIAIKSGIRYWQSLMVIVIRTIFLILHLHRVVCFVGHKGNVLWYSHLSTLCTGLRDLRVLHRELHQVSHKWYSLGIQLQIPIGSLKHIKIENRQLTICLLEMLNLWLQCTNPPATWSILIEALESSPVEERLLAQQLRDKYCPGRERQVNHGYQGPSPSGALSTPQGN